MVTSTKYKPICIPVDGNPSLLPPLVIARDDLTNNRAWGKLEEDKYFPFLEVQDFTDTGLYEKYWFASLGFLEYPYLFVVGAKGDGKSLFLNYVLHKITKYYGKKATINWVGENAKLISPYNKWEIGDKTEPYYSLTDEDYVSKIQDEINELAHTMAVERRKPTKKELEALILFNAMFCIDEGSGVAGKGLGTNMIKLLGMIADRQRHLFLGMAISFVKPQDASGSLIADNATHIINCSRNVYYRGACSYRIFSKRQGITKMLHLKPEEWVHLWDSHNLVAINSAVNVQFGNKKAKEVEKKRKLLKEGV
jgi:hypothetical protein